MLDLILPKLFVNFVYLSTPKCICMLENEFEKK